MSPQTEEKLLLSILTAWQQDGTEREVPWHITDEAWVFYTQHPSKKVSNAAYANPFLNTLSIELQEKRKARIEALSKL